MLLLFSLGSSTAAFASDLPAYIGGAYATLLTHELGHAAIAKWYGSSDVSIEIPREGASFYSGATHYTRDSKEMRSESFDRAMSLSGLVSANILGEIILHSESMHDELLAQGALSMVQVSNIMHVMKFYSNYRASDGMINDLNRYEMAGGNPHVASVVLVAYTMLNLRRMRDDSIPIFGIDIDF